MKTLMIFLVLTVSLWAKDVDLAPFKKLKMFSDGRLELERVYDHGSIYQIRFTTMTQQGKRAFEGFITKDKKVMIVGDSVEIETRTPLSMPMDMAKVKKNADIVYGTGKTELIVITDPECYYCQAFQNRWNEIKDRYKLYVYLYPLGHHEEAKQMSYHVLKQKGDADRAQALIKIAQDATADRLTAKRMQQGVKGLTLTSKDYTKTKVSKKELKKFSQKLEDNAVFGDSLGVRGTPAVFDHKGKFVIWSKLFD